MKLLCAGLPEGLVYHCESCRVVVPAEAPRPETPGDCATVAKHKLAWFNPEASLRHQHVMATGAWELIHWHHLHGDAKHAACVDYKRQFNRRPDEHWQNSEVAKALLPAPSIADSSS